MRVTQSCLKFTDLLKNQTHMINLSLMKASMMSQARICKKSRVSKSETFLKIFISFLLLLPFSFIKYTFLLRKTKLEEF